MLGKRRLYISISPFQFLAALLRAYEYKDEEKSFFIFIRFGKDANNYSELIKILRLNDFIEYHEISGVKNDYIRFIKLCKLVALNRNRILSDYIYVGDYYRFIAVCSALFFRRLKMLGDGADIVWDRTFSNYNKFQSNFLFYLFHFYSPYQFRKALDAKIFQKKWKFLKDFYKNLPMKDDVWIIGNSTPFSKLFPITEYSPIVQEYLKERKRLINLDEYKFQLECIINHFNSHPILYFPHRNEVITEWHNDHLNIYQEKYFLEVVPLLLGYLPRYIIGSSTCIFSYCMIRHNIDRDFTIFFIPQIPKCDEVYQEYGAREFQLDPTDFRN